MPDLKELNLATISDVDFGKADKAFQMALKRVVADCIDRPADKRVRKVTLQITLKPVVDIIDNLVTCEGASGAFQVRAKMPDYETGEVDFGVKNNGSLFFNPESPRNHRQECLEFEGGE